jgi:hypothetical protein
MDFDYLPMQGQQLTTRANSRYRIYPEDMMEGIPDPMGIRCPVSRNVDWSELSSQTSPVMYRPVEAKGIGEEASCLELRRSSFVYGVKGGVKCFWKSSDSS